MLVWELAARQLICKVDRSSLPLQKGGGLVVNHVFWKLISSPTLFLAEMKFLGILLLAAALVLADDSDSGNEGATASNSQTQGRTGSTGSTSTTGNDAQGNTRFFGGGGGLNSLLGAGTALAGGFLGAALGNQNFGGRPGGFGGRPVNTGFGGRPVNTGFGGRPVNTGFGGRPVNTGFGGRPVNPGFGGGFNQGGFNQGGFNQGGFNQGGFNQGGFNQGGFNQGIGGGCRLSCRAPNGQFVCCGNGGGGSGGFGGNKPGQCPPVRPVCPPTRSFAPPQSCFNDRACGGVDKCCFDTCLKDRVCKPPSGIGGFGR